MRQWPGPILVFVKIDRGLETFFKEKSLEVLSNYLIEISLHLIVTNITYSKLRGNCKFQKNGILLFRSNVLTNFSNFTEIKLD